MNTNGLAATILVLIASCFLTASAADNSLDAAPGRERYIEGPAIWQVSDHDTTVYLFGTVHILTKKTKWRTEHFNELWESADAVFLEADISQASQAELQKLVFSLGMNKPGTTLSSYFNKAERDFISGEIKKFGLSLRALDPLRPWYAAINISVLQIVAAGGDPASGVDNVLGEEARSTGKSMRFFETAEEQIGFFAGLPDQISAEMLIGSLQQSKENPNYFIDLIIAWQTGSLDSLELMLIQSVHESDPLIAKTILYDRNANWADTLETVMDEEPGIFIVAVGAGHLVGEKSLLHFLSKKGLMAKRL